MFGRKIGNSSDVSSSKASSRHSGHSSRHSGHSSRHSGHSGHSSRHSSRHSKDSSKNSNRYLKSSSKSKSNNPRPSAFLSETPRSVQDSISAADSVSQIQSNVLDDESSVSYNDQGRSRVSGHSGAYTGSNISANRSGLGTDITSNDHFYNHFDPYAPDEQWKEVAHRRGFLSDGSSAISRSDLGSESSFQGSSLSQGATDSRFLEASGRSSVRGSRHKKSSTQEEPSVLVFETDSDESEGYMKDRRTSAFWKRSSLILESLNFRSLLTSLRSFPGAAAVRYKRNKLFILLGFLAFVFFISLGISLLGILELSNTKPLSGSILNNGKAPCLEVASEWSSWLSCENFCQNTNRYRTREVQYNKVKPDEGFCNSIDSDSCLRHCNTFGLLVQGYNADMTLLTKIHCEREIIASISEAFAIESSRVTVYDILELANVNGGNDTLIQFSVRAVNSYQLSETIDGNIFASPQVCDNFAVIRTEIENTQSQLYTGIMSTCFTGTHNIRPLVLKHSNFEEIEGSGVNHQYIQENQMCLLDN